MRGVRTAIADAASDTWCWAPSASARRSRRRSAQRIERRELLALSDGPGGAHDRRDAAWLGRVVAPGVRDTAVDDHVTGLQPGFAGLGDEHAGTGDDDHVVD